MKTLWPRVGVGFVAGPPGSGKSFWVLEQVSKIAKGEEVLGRRVVQSGAVYIAAEGANGVRARFEALRHRVGPWNGLIRFIADAPVLTDAGDLIQLRLALLRIKKLMEEQGYRLGVVTIDTLSASMPGADENNSKEMSSMLGGLQNMSTELDAFVLVVAHVGKDADRGIRGWSGQLANADAVITFVPPEDDGTRCGAIVKVKDAEAGERFAFKLDVVELGIDDDGDPVTTCVAVECPPPPRKNPKSRMASLGAPAELVLRAIDRLDAQAVDVSHIESTVRGQKGLTLKVLRDGAYEMGLHAEMEPDADDTRHWKRFGIGER